MLNAIYKIIRDALALFGLYVLVLLIKVVIEDEYVRYLIVNLWR